MTEVSEISSRKAAGIGLLLLAIGLLTYGVYALTIGQQRQQTEESGRLNRQISEAVSIGKSGDYKRAVTMLREIVKTHPKNVDALYNYGTALRAINDLDSADKVFQNLLLLSPEDYEAWVERASVAVLKGDIETAFDFLEKVPRGKGNLILRLRSDPKWKEFSEHPRMKKVQAIQGLTTLTY